MWWLSCLGCSGGGDDDCGVSVLVVLVVLVVCGYNVGKYSQFIDTYSTLKHKTNHEKILEPLYSREIYIMKIMPLNTPQKKPT